ncbi:hypothetical protein EDC01DRAFT_627372 [Geopyxis carbonaria]|nr:hypothetical protein EDC01DRAFT_627372 [Geopyxis carbonaria]
MPQLIRSLRTPFYALLIALVVIALLQSLLSISPLPRPPYPRPPHEPQGPFQPNYPHHPHARPPVVITPHAHTANLLSTDDPAPDTPPTTGDARTQDPNPIPHLITASEKAWTHRLSTQSTSLAAAEDEYARRYSHPPPRGFREWYSWASRNGVQLLDEFDVLMASITPLLEAGAATLRGRVDALLDAGDEGMGWIKVGGEGAWEAHGDVAQEFVDLLKDVKHLLPRPAAAYRVPFNTLPLTPRVLAVARSPPPPTPYQSLTGRPLLTALSTACGPASPLARGAHKVRYEFDTSELHPSNRAPGVDADLCLHPAALAGDAALLQDPPLNVIAAPLPLLNPWGRALGFLDIPVARPAAADTPPASEGDGEAEPDRDWASRQARLFAPPAPTTPVAYPGSHPSHRLSALLHPTSPVSLPSTTLTPREAAGLLTPDVSSARLVLSDHRAPFGSTPALQLRSTSWRWTQWHSDRLQAWVHYVPLSAGMDEVWSVVAHFLVPRRAGREPREDGQGGDGEEWLGEGIMGDGMVGGDEEAERIAGQGREWSSRLGAGEARVAWNWRVLIEVQRVLEGGGGGGGTVDA